MTDIERRGLTEEETEKIVEAARAVRAILNQDYDSETYLRESALLQDAVESTPAGPWYLHPEPFTSLPKPLQKPMRDLAYIACSGSINAPANGDPIKRESVERQIDVLLAACAKTEYLGITLDYREREVSREWNGKQYGPLEFGKKERPWQLLSMLVDAGDDGLHRRDLEDAIGSNLDNHKATLIKMLQDVKLTIKVGKWKLRHVGK